MSYHHQMKKLLTRYEFGIMLLPVIFKKALTLHFKHSAHFLENFNTAEQVLGFPRQRHLLCIIFNISFHRQLSDFFVFIINFVADTVKTFIAGSTVIIQAVLSEEHITDFAVHAFVDTFDNFAEVFTNFSTCE